MTTRESGTVRAVATGQAELSAESVKQAMERCLDELERVFGTFAYTVESVNQVVVPMRVVPEPGPFIIVTVVGVMETYLESLDVPGHKGTVSP